MPWIAKRRQDYAPVFHGCTCCPRAAAARGWREKSQETLVLMGKQPCANCKGRGCRTCRTRAA